MFCSMTYRPTIQIDNVLCAPIGKENLHQKFQPSILNIGREFHVSHIICLTKLDEQDLYDALLFILFLLEALNKLNQQV